MKRNNLFTVPNLVTMIHFCLLPFLYVSLENGLWIKAGFIFLLAGILDVLDGFSAKVLNQFSEIGKFFDPITDKIRDMIVLIFLLNLTGSQIYKTIFWFFIFIEIILIAGTIFIILCKKTEKFQVTRFGKISMFFFFLMLNGFIFNLEFQNQIGYQILFYLAIILIFVRSYCLIKYFNKFFKK